MEFKARPVVVNMDDPFACDLLGRKAAIENLTILLRTISSPMVLSVNGRWGTGKSTFINLWSNYLEREGFQVLNFNAWTTDFSEDPLVAFLGEMNSNLERRLVKDGQRNEAWEKCKKLGGFIAQRSVPMALRLATAGILSGTELIESEAMSLVGNVAEDAVKAYEATRSKIVEFKRLLSEVVVALDTELPLVIFVDELDRCRPTYAIELLERVKHLFDQSGIVFVLAMDREQLCHSIGAVYGGIDAAGYLRRFIDLEYSLPLPSRRAYVEGLLATFSLNNYFENRCKFGGRTTERDHLVSTLSRMVELYNLQLRDIEQLFSRLSLALHATPREEQVPTPLLVFLTVIREKNSDIYAYLKAGKDVLVDAVNLIQSLRVSKQAVSDEDDPNYPISLVEGCMISVLPSLESKRMLERFESQLRVFSDMTTYNYAQVVLREAEAYKGIHISKLIDRIEIASQLRFSQFQDLT